MDDQELKPFDLLSGNTDSDSIPEKTLPPEEKKPVVAKPLLVRKKKTTSEDISDSKTRGLKIIVKSFLSEEQLRALKIFAIINKTSLSGALRLLVDLASKELTESYSKKEIETLNKFV